MTETTETPTGGAPEAILVAMDFSAAAMRALDVALAWKQPGAEITLLNVVDVHFAQDVRDSGLAVGGDPAEKLAADAAERLAKLIRDRGLTNVQPMVVHGIPFVEIVKVAVDLDLDLIVIGRSGRADVEHVLFGGTAEKVLRAGNRPVLCIP